MTEQKRGPCVCHMVQFVLLSQHLERYKSRFLVPISLFLPPSSSSQTMAVIRTSKTQAPCYTQQYFSSALGIKKPMVLSVVIRSVPPHMNKPKPKSKPTRPAPKLVPYVLMPTRAQAKKTQHHVHWSKGMSFHCHTLIYSTHPPPVPSATPNDPQSARLPHSPTSLLTTDAHERHWPTHNTYMNTDIPGKLGLCRVDDQTANAACGAGERLRRTEFLRRTYKALGRGLYAMREADHKGQLEHIFTETQHTLGTSQRISHFPLTTDEHYLEVSKLPSGYAIFQAPRPQDRSKDSFTGKAEKRGGDGFVHLRIGTSRMLHIRGGVHPTPLLAAHRMSQCMLVLALQALTWSERARA